MWKQESGSQTHKMVTSTEVIAEYSTSNEFRNYTADEKLVECDRKIAQLSCELLYYKNQLLIQSDGITTKKGRLSKLSSNDNSVLNKNRWEIRCRKNIFAIQIHIEKSVHDLRKDKLGSVIMDELNISVRKAVAGEPRGTIENLNFRECMMWWHKNCELVEQLFVEHQTKKHRNWKSDIWQVCENL